MAVDDQMFNTICDEIACGKSLRKACEERGQHVRVFLAFMERDNERSKRYTRARNMQADHFGEQIGEISQAVLAGEYDYNAARVAMDGLKWTAARMSPRKWGDRVEHEHTGEIHIKRVVLNDEDEGPKSLPGIVDVEAKQIEE